MNRTTAGRFAGLPSPAWLIALSIVPLHITAAAFYCLVGAFQFDSGVNP